MNGTAKELDQKMEECKRTAVYMWGYLPGVSPEKSPIRSPAPVIRPSSIDGGESWKDVCSGGCGFAMAISESGKLITWGSSDDEGQSYLTSGRHGETPEPLPLPTEASVIKATAGWSHCVTVTETGEVYAWGWKECVPSGKFARDSANGGSFVKDITVNHNASPPEQVSPGGVSHPDNKKSGEETVKRRKILPTKEEPESLGSVEEYFAVSPSPVTLGLGVKVTAVAAGGRHTLVLSDMGQVWGWGYGGEGQLGLGSRTKSVPAPHLIPCLEPVSGKERSPVTQGSSNLSIKVAGGYVKGIACGGRHSAVITDTGALLTFGWGLYGQCGQGNTHDELRPTVVSSLSGVQVERVAAGLWHTICLSVEGHIYSFGGNQFGQLGTGADQAETLPRLLDAPCLEKKNVKLVSSGARHNAVLTEDGQVLTWGWNKYGQLGLGDSIDRNVPAQVPIEGCMPKDVACGWWHTLMLAENSP